MNEVLVIFLQFLAQIFQLFSCELPMPPLGRFPVVCSHFLGYCFPKEARPVGQDTTTFDNSRECRNHGVDRSFRREDHRRDGQLLKLLIDSLEHRNLVDTFESRWIKIHPQGCQVERLQDR
jgi:hypothetical protein